MSETIEARSIVVERSYAHAPAKLWRALTEGDLLARWIMANDFAPEAGRRFAFRTEPVGHWNGVVQCEVLEITPPSRLVLRWGDGTPDGGGIVTTVAFTLTPEGAGAHLRMEQSGFTPDQEQNRRGAQFGWTKMMEGLDGLLAEIDA
ncbi:SRPBCC domain-containing protein [Phenylobacterium sp.]|uniref:SRPBCC family protein n=1 Tax=Phenylobacterium sp. TaxID=1871053 RepID=UPI002DF09BDB|nr:SRPBCC domain-containing protein [Phenylobacterium sp.]